MNINKHPIIFFAWKSWIKNKRQSLFLSSGLCLSSALLILLGFFLNSYLLSDQQYQIKVNGKQEALFLDCNPQMLEKLKSGQIDQLGFVSVYAVHEIPESVTGEKITVGSYDRTAMELTHMNQLQGRLPQNPQEIVLEKSAFLKLRKIPQLEIEIDLNLAFLSGDGGFSEQAKTSRFTVVGIAENISEHQNDNHNAVAGYTNLPHAIVSGDWFQENTYVTHHALVYIDPQKPVRDVIDMLASDETMFRSLYRNYAVYGFIFNQTNAGSVFPYVLAVLLGTVIILISNLSHKVVLKSKKQQFLRLKLAGVQPNQLIYFCVWQTVFSVILSLPVAILLGLLGSYMVSSLIHAYFFPEFAFSFSWIILISALLINGVISIFSGIIPAVEAVKRRPLEAYRPKAVKKIRISRRSASIRNPVTLWGIKSTLSNFGEFASVCISIALCLMIVFVSVLVSREYVEVSRTDLSYDYYLSEVNGWFWGNMGTPADMEDGIRQADIDLFLSEKEVGHVWATQNMAVNILISEPTKNFLNVYKDQELVVPFSEDDFLTEKESFGYGAAERLFSSSLGGTDWETLNKLKKYLSSGKLDREKLASGKEVVLFDSSGKCPYRVGDQVLLTQIISGTSPPETAHRLDLRVSICAILLFDNPNAPEAEAFSDFYWLNEAFSKYNLDMHYNHVYIELANKNHFENTEAKIDMIKNDYPFFYVESLRKNQDDVTMVLRYVTALRIIVTGILCSYGLFVLINTLKSRIKERRRIYGVLRAVGMDKKQLTSALFTEIAFVISLAWILGIILSVLTCMLLKRSLSLSFITTLPFGWALAGLIVLLLIGYLICLSCVGWLYQKSIVQQIKTIE